MSDLVVLSLEAWDEVWRRNQHLVAGLLRRDPTLRVLFVEPAADPLHEAVTHRRGVRPRGLRPVPLPGAEGRLWSYQPLKPLPRRLDPRADARLAGKVVRAAERLGFRRPTLWINDPAGAEVLRRTGWPALYDVTDDWLEADRGPAAHDRLVRDEATLMGRCADVVVCSPTLAAAKGAGRPVTLIPNAVDVEFYRRPQPRPADLPAGRVALYVGTVHTDRMDVGLCVATGRALGDAGTLVLVGPHPLGGSDLERLRGAGVLLLGAKPAAEVPGYLQHADVLVVPHVVTPFTLSLDPIKRYEYAAVGRPVVSTPVTGFVDAGDPRITVATGGDFAAAVRAALTSRDAPGPAGGGDVADWGDRVEQMAGVLERVSGSAADGRPLRLVIDVLSAPARSGGMRRYAEEVIHAWHEAPGAADDELIVHGEPWILEAFRDLPRVQSVPIPGDRRGRRLTRQWFGTAALYRRTRADAVLALGPVVTGLVPRDRRFCVVHDWRHVRRPEEFAWPIRAYRRLWVPVLRRAGGVAAISEKTAAETLVQVPDARVRVVPNGTDHARRWDVDPCSGAPLVVTFGHLPNKRPDLVLRAFAALPEPVRRGVRLIVLGVEGERRSHLARLAAELGVGASVDLPGYAPDRDYQKAVACASVVVLASTDEGFGLPVVEGRFFGATVVTTRDSGLADVHGDAVVVADPTPSSLADAIRAGLGAERSPRRSGPSWVDTAAGLRRLLVEGATARER